jgi:Ca2+/Na+ antiporter
VYQLVACLSSVLALTVAAITHVTPLKAVSSSIGSNIFDILFGLPFPWLLRSMIPKKDADPGSWPASVTINSEGAWIDIGILIGMVFLTVSSIALFGWKMSKHFG